MKKSTLVLFGCLISMVILSLFGESAAGVVIGQVVRDREGVASKVVLHLSEFQFRTDRPERGLMTIMDFQKDRLFLIDHRSQSYVEVKLSQWEKEIAERLKKGMPGVQTKRRKISVRKTGETSTINGFRTEKVEVLADGELIEEDWVTRDVDLKEVEKVMDRVAQGFSKDLRLEMKEGREIYEQLKNHGFPIRTKDYTLTYGLGGVDVVEVRKIERKELKEEVFAPPAGYKRVIPEPSRK
jgi:hypothetical protein